VVSRPSPGTMTVSRSMGVMSNHDIASARLDVLNSNVRAHEVDHELPVLDTSSNDRIGMVSMMPFFLVRIGAIPSRLRCGPRHTASLRHPVWSSTPGQTGPFVAIGHGASYLATSSGLHREPAVCLRRVFGASRWICPDGCGIGWPTKKSAHRIR
jgi:hypothetical protein